MTNIFAGCPFSKLADHLTAAAELFVRDSDDEEEEDEDRDNEPEDDEDSEDEGDGYSE